MRIYLTFFVILFGMQVQAQKSINDLVVSGNQKEELNDYKGAYLDFEKARMLEPGNSKVLYYLGFTKIQMEDYANAITDFNLAIESDTESVELYYWRANARFEMKNYKEAISD